MITCLIMLNMTAINLTDTPTLQGVRYKVNNIISVRRMLRHIWYHDSHHMLCTHISGCNFHSWKFNEPTKEENKLGFFILFMSGITPSGCPEAESPSTPITSVAFEEERMFAAADPELPQSIQNAPRSLLLQSTTFTIIVILSNLWPLRSIQFCLQ